MKGARESNSSLSAHEKLRGWYLAHLRKRALLEEEKLQLTPAGLVAADCAVVDHIIQTERESSVDEAALESSKSYPPFLLFVLLVACLGILHVCTCVPSIQNSLPFFIRVFVQGLVPVGLIYIALTYKGVLDQSDLMRRCIERSLNDTEYAPGRLQGLERTVIAALLKIRRLEERERLIADFSDQVICAFDENAVIVAASPNSLRILGLAPVMLLGKHPKQLPLLEGGDRAINAFQTALESHKEISSDFRWLRPDGTQLDFLWTIEWSPTAKMYFVTLKDVTVEKRVERLKAEVLASITHDLRAPLSALKLYFDLARMGIFGQLNIVGEERTSLAQDTTEHLISVATDLLELERIEQGKQELHVGIAAVEGIIAQATESVRALAQDKEITLTVNPPLDEIGIAISVDSTKLVRVVTNLLYNAIKFSPVSSEVKVVVEAADRDCNIHVIDKGRGIRKKDQERIFDRFEQGESDDKTLRGSIGLGLSICRKIVEAHGGTINLSSTEGEGCKFTVSLPFETSSPVASEPKMSRHTV